MKIFNHLLDYGLRECRLVCRKWYAVCQLFPVKLRNVSIENLDALALGFPNTISLKMEPSYWDDDLSECAKRLAAFPNLQHVQWTVRDLWDGRRSGAIFEPLHKLKHLDLTLEDYSLTPEEYSSLRFLTSLTKLTLIRYNNARQAEENVAPFAELREIRELRISGSLFVAQNGMGQFPALTNLTALDLRSESGRLVSMTQSLRYVRHSFRRASSQELSSGDLVPCRDSSDAAHRLISLSESVNYTPLQALKRLTTLEVKGHVRMYHMSLLESLRKMDSLQDLRIRVSWLEGPEIAVENLASIFACSRLRSLEFGFHCAGPIDPFPHCLTELTKLVTSILQPIPEMLVSAQQLLQLELGVLSEWTAEMNQALDSLTSLRSPSIAGDGFSRTPVLSSKTLGGLTQLQSLSLERISVDKRLFQELASLKKLTTLRIKNCSLEKCPDFFLSGMNLMTSLEELELQLPAECKIACYLSPRCLPKLERLIIGGSDRMVPLLRKKLAVNPRLRVNPLPSPWCSPGSDENVSVCPSHV